MLSLPPLLLLFERAPYSIFMYGGFQSDAAAEPAEEHIGFRHGLMMTIGMLLSILSISLLSLRLLLLLLLSFELDYTGWW
jgi:hypothetical protein